MAGYIGTTPVPQATQHRESFTATGGQTSFATVGYTPQFIDVYLNGVKLAPADFTATNGSDVVLASGATASDILEIVAYTPFEVANQTFTGTTTAANLTVTGAFTSQGIDDNADAVAITIDSSENVGIGTSSPYTLLELSSIDPILRFNDSNGGTDTKNFELRYVGTSSPDIDGLYFRTVNDANTVYSDKMVILGSGNVSIGTSSPNSYSNQTVLTINGTDYGRVDLEAGGTLKGSVFGGGDGLNLDAGANQLVMFAGGSEAMRLDASRNLLVGTTNKNIRDSSSEEGMVYRNGLTLDINTSAAPVIIMNRVGNSDGDIALFRKDGSTVGSIAAKDGDIAIGTSGVGLRFGQNAGDSIRPHSMSTNGGKDNSLDLGSSGARFKDLYLSGGVYLGGTGSANKLDDYEEGTWTPTFITTSGTVSYTVQSGWYRKVGQLVFLAADVVASCTNSATLESIANFPFTVGSTSGFYPGPAISNAYNVSLGSGGTALGGYWVNGDTRLRFHSYGNNTNQLTPSISSSGTWEVRMTGFYST